MYNSYKYHVQRADVIRYLIMYEYGGIYTDLDILPKYSIAPLVNLYECDDNIQVLLPPSSNIDTYVSNNFIISKRKSPFWELVINKLLINSTKKYTTKHNTVMKQTGPILITDAFKEYNKKFDNKLQSPIVIIPKDFSSFL